MDSLGDEIPVSYIVTAQFVTDDFPRFSAMGPFEPPEEALCSSSISPGLQEHINDITILVNRPP